MGRTTVQRRAPALRVVSPTWLAWSRTSALRWRNPDAPRTGAVPSFRLTASPMVRKRLFTARQSSSVVEQRTHKHLSPNAAETSGAMCAFFLWNLKVRVRGLAPVAENCGQSGLRKAIGNDSIHRVVSGMASGVKRLLDNGAEEPIYSRLSRWPASHSSNKASAGVAFYANTWTKLMGPDNHSPRHTDAETQKRTCAMGAIKEGINVKTDIRKRN